MRFLPPFTGTATCLEELSKYPGDDLLRPSGEGGGGSEGSDDGTGGAEEPPPVAVWGAAEEPPPSDGGELFRGYSLPAWIKLILRLAYIISSSVRTSDCFGSGIILIRPSCTVIPVLVK